MVPSVLLFRLLLRLSRFPAAVLGYLRRVISSKRPNCKRLLPVWTNVSSKVSQVVSASTPSRQYLANTRPKLGTLGPSTTKFLYRLTIPYVSHGPPTSSCSRATLLTEETVTDNWVHKGQLT
ncbi:hypothetical protein FPV67DRAFT_1091293 [Lyophyllum atratum]|nr:hypothetical protein FPV67DRAFT_1091293 [Lyophyllum atratum]